MLSLLIGGFMAARAYPEGFDWAFQVISSLASLQRNPHGARWLSVVLVFAMLALWPLTGELRSTRLVRNALRVGLLFGMLMGLERAVLFDASSVVYKSHELLALLCFAGLYVGTLALCLGAWRSRVPPRWPALLAGGSLLAIGAVQVLLWWLQRDYGWIGRDWRARGIPVWQSFALWQWAASATLLLALGYFAFSGRSTNRPASSQASGLPDPRATAHNRPDAGKARPAQMRIDE